MDGMRPGALKLPPGGLPSGRLVVPVDTSTSTLIKPGTEPQIQYGQTELTTHTDVEYAHGLKMDIQVPKTAGPKPLVVYVPGGGFVFAAKEIGLDMRTFVADAGYVVASIQYRTTMTGAVYTDGISDVQSAVRFLRAHADEYEIDPARVALWGESAGGYLVSMAGLTHGDEVRAVVDKFGPSDLSKVMADYDPADLEKFAMFTSSLARYVLGPATTRTLADEPEAVAKANPATYGKPGDPAFLLFHGTADTLVSPSQTLMLHNALTAAGVDSTRYVVDGAGHGDLAFSGDPATGLPWTTRQVMGIIVDFFGEHLK
jgi:acetyl esterase/lipase